MSNLLGVLRAALVALVSTALLIFTPGAASPAPSVDADRVQHLTLSDPSVGEAQVRVLLPAGYHDPANLDRPYPVLYLLHGSDGSSSDWLDKTDVEQLTAPHDLIVVMPDAGANGFYSDWLDGPAWETFHIERLIPTIDGTYRTLATRQGRAVAGLSMGGYGAMVYAARHPDLFVASASFSGAVDIADGHLPEALALELLGFEAEARWGPFATHEIVWRDHNPPDLAGNLRWTRLDAFAGNGVPRPGDNPGSGINEAGTYIMSSAFHARLLAAGVEHGWHDYGPGTHEWHYWQQDLHDWLPTLLATFADPPAAPDAFDYRTAEASFSLYGWSFAVDRPAQEFLELTGVSAAGLTARGSGRLDVVTPPTYEPGRVYQMVSTPRTGAVRPDDLAATLSSVQLATAPAAPGVGETTVVRSGGDRRLRFSLDLGPGHTARQFTPEADAAALADPAGYWGVRHVTIAPTTASRPPSSPPPGRSAGAGAAARTAPRGARGVGATPVDTLPATGGSDAAVVALLGLAVALGSLQLRSARSGDDM